MQKEIRESITLENEGLKLFGILHRPQSCLSGQKAPCVVIVHGLGGNKSGRFRLITRLSAALSANGIASFRFDCRGAGDSEGNFADTTLESLTSDTLCALRYVATHPSIDAQSLALCGRSFGGAVSVRAAAHYLDASPGSIKALALWAAIFDAKPWLQAKKKEQSGGDFRFHGMPLSQPFIAQFASYDASAALASLNNTSLLVIQGDKDTTVDKYHAEQYALLRQQNENTMVLHLPQSDHEFSDMAEQNIAINETVDFLKRVFYDAADVSSRK